jgi:hypothetical protein
MAAAIASPKGAPYLVSELLEGVAADNVSSHCAHNQTVRCFHQQS